MSFWYLRTVHWKKKKYPSNHCEYDAPACLVSVCHWFHLFALLWVMFDCRTMLLHDGGWSPTARWRCPRRPIRTRNPKQEQSSLQVGERIEQWFLGTYLHFGADGCIFVALRVVVDAVDLKQTRIGRMVGAVVTCHFTVLVHDVSPTSIRTRAAFA